MSTGVSPGGDLRSRGTAAGSGGNKKMLASNILGSGSSRAEYYRVRNEQRPVPVYSSMQYKSAPSKVPWKSILLAIFLSVVGTTLLTTGCLMLSGHVDVKHFPPNRTWPMIVLGAIMFIPGVYHVRVALMAWWGYEGYSFDDIPDYD